MSDNIQLQITTIENEFDKDLASLTYDEIYIKYLGKKGIINKQFADLKNDKTIDTNKNAYIYKELNKLKKKLQDTLDNIKSEEVEDLVSDIDLTIPVKKSITGNLHPLTKVTRDLNEFFKYYGFSIGDGPHIEDDYHNFEMMGVPKDHPARDLQDTLYILEPEILLRTQTSNVEARYLEDYDPPIRVVVPGVVFRNETANKTNSPIFTQYQGFYVDQNVTMSNLKWIFETAFKHVLGDDTVVRYRSKFYPEVKPGMSPDIRCKFCEGKGCAICKYRGWIEISGGGMIHPETLRKANIDPKLYSGFAFGMGLDRLAMTKYKISDIRSLYDGSIVYL